MTRLNLVSKTNKKLPSGSFYSAIFQIAMENGTPRVLMSDDIKAAFKAELGIS